MEKTRAANVDSVELEKARGASVNSVELEKARKAGAGSSDLNAVAAAPENGACASDIPASDGVHDVSKVNGPEAELDSKETQRSQNSVQSSQEGDRVSDNGAPACEGVETSLKQQLATENSTVQVNTGLMCNDNVDNGDGVNKGSVKELYNGDDRCESVTDSESFTTQNPASRERKIPELEDEDGDENQEDSEITMDSLVPEASVSERTEKRHSMPDLMVQARGDKSGDPDVKESTGDSDARRRSASAETGLTGKAEKRVDSDGNTTATVQAKLSAIAGEYSLLHWEN
jgi:hypothetical protein